MTEAMPMITGTAPFGMDPGFITAFGSTIDGNTIIGCMAAVIIMADLIITEVLPFITMGEDTMGMITIELEGATTDLISLESKR